MCCIHEHEVIANNRSQTPTGQKSMAMSKWLTYPCKLVAEYGEKLKLQMDAMDIVLTFQRERSPQKRGLDPASCCKIVDNRVDWTPHNESWTSEPVRNRRVVQKSLDSSENKKKHYLKKQESSLEEKIGTSKDGKILNTSKNCHEKTASKLDIMKCDIKWTAFVARVSDS